MRPLETLSRVALGWVFVQAGTDVVRAPAGPAAKAAPVIAAIRDRSPVPMPDDETVVRLNAAVQVLAGTALSIGIVPRLASAALIGSIVPTSFGGHRFWELDGPERTVQRNSFIKNVSIAGGLLHVLITPRKDHR